MEQQLELFPCDHAWVLHMIQMPEGYEKPGSTICSKCHANKYDIDTIITTTPWNQNLTPSVFYGVGFCVWREDADGNWDTACRKKWVLNEGTPIEHEMQFCPCCGKQLAQMSYVMNHTDVV